MLIHRHGKACRPRFGPVKEFRHNPRSALPAPFTQR